MAISLDPAALTAAIAAASKLLPNEWRANVESAVGGRHRGVSAASDRALRPLRRVLLRVPVRRVG